MISIWDKPAELNIAPIPFEIMLKAGMAKDKMYQDSLDEIKPYEDAILNSKALPGDDTDYLKQASQKLRDLVNNTVGKKDITDPLEASNFLNQAKQIALDPKLKRNESYFNHVQEQKKKQQDYKDKPNGTYNSQSFDFDKTLSQYITPGSGGGDKFNIANKSIGSIGVDRRETLEKAFDDMTKSSGYSFKQLGDYLFKTSQEGFGQTQIDNAAKYALSSIAQSDAGKQILSDYNMYKELDPKTYENIKPEQYLLQQLAQVGYEKIGMSQNSNYDDVFNHAIDKQKEEADSYITPETFDGEYTTTDAEQFDVAKQYGNYGYDEQGNIFIKPAVEASAPSGGGVMGGGIMGGSPFTTDVKYEDKTQEVANNQTQKLRTEINYYRNNYPELKDMKDEQLVPIINKARQKTAQSFKGFSIAGLDKESLAAKITSNIANRTLYKVSNKGTEQVSYSDINGGNKGDDLKNYIYTEIKEGRAEFVPLSKTNKAGFNVQIPSKSGDLQTIFISASDQSQLIFSPFNAVRKVFDKATPGVYTEDKYKVNKGNEDKKDDDYGTEAKLELVKDDNGNIVDSYYSINRILSEQMTDKTLKANNLTYQTALQKGFKFDSKGRMLINPTGDLKKEVNGYYNSPYLEKEKKETKPNTFKP